MARKRRRNQNSGNGKNYIWLVLVGIIASIAIYFAFVANMVNVVVATETVQSGTQIKANMVTTKRVDKSALPSKYITAENAQSLVGLYTNVGITEGSVFTSANVATKDTKKSAVIPDGYTLLSINVSSIPKGIESGDKINLLIGISSSSDGRIVMTYQNVLVTSTYLNNDGDITGLEVQVTPEQAQKIQFAQLNGDLSVSLLPPSYEEESLKSVDAKSIQSFSGADSSNVSIGNGSSRDNSNSNSDSDKDADDED